ncbi:hypothetical protein GCM10011362_06940 [Marinobacter halophilus]|nr:hypothetical protein GCM10011362_06940 [Marinobacter halophilus]
MWQCQSFQRAMRIEISKAEASNSRPVIMLADELRSVIMAAEIRISKKPLMRGWTLLC